MACYVMAVLAFVLGVLTLVLAAVVAAELVAFELGLYRRLLHSQDRTYRGRARHVTGREIAVLRDG